MDCSGGEEVSLESGVRRKLDALDKVLARQKAPRTLVFCNKIESCRAVENALRRKHDPSEVQVRALRRRSTSSSSPSIRVRPCFEQRTLRP